MPPRGSPSKLAEVINRHPAALFLGLSLLYLAFALPLVAVRIFTEDEFYTLYQSHLPTVGALWGYLRVSSEGQTPAFMLVTQFLVSHFGDSPFVLRLPAVVGFWTMLAAIYRILVPRCGALWAACGVLLALASRSAPFSAEARSYGLLLGASALALLCWLRARRRPTLGPCLWLAAALVFAAATHYYAVFVVLPLAVAQAVHDRRKGIVQPLVWLAFATVFLPNVAALPIIRSSRALLHFWSPPRAAQLADTFMNVLGPEFGAILAVALLAALSAGGTPGLPRVDRDESIAYWGYVALPLAGWVFAVLVTHAYVERYMPQALIGIAILFALALAARFGPDRRAGLVAAVCLFCFCVSLCAARIQNAVGEREAVADTARALQRLAPGELPLAVSSAEVWLRLDYLHLPGARFTYLCDPDLTLRYENQNMVEAELHDHPFLYPASLNMFQPFVARRQPFFVLSVDAFHPDWLTTELVTERWTLRFLGRAPLGNVFRADPPSQ